MGSMLAKIRAATPPHTLLPIADDLDELNVDCRRYHHGENPAPTTETIDDAEPGGYVKRTLELVGGLL